MDTYICAPWTYCAANIDYKKLGVQCTATTPYVINANLGMFAGYTFTCPVQTVRATGASSLMAGSATALAIATLYA
tara:strand:+ start:202 stop:429 length:228 start_codon:yes stop_codon:yes gene_type:complete